MELSYISFITQPDIPAIFTGVHYMPKLILYRIIIANLAVFRLGIAVKNWYFPDATMLFYTKLWCCIQGPSCDVNTKQAKILYKVTDFHNILLGLAVC